MAGNDQSYSKSSNCVLFIYFFFFLISLLFKIEPVTLFTSFFFLQENLRLKHLV